MTRPTSSAPGKNPQDAASVKQEAEDATNLDSSILYPAFGDNQRVYPNQDFESYLRAEVQGNNLAGATVTFTLQSDLVTFDYERTPLKGTVQNSSRECTVPLQSAGGYALSPAIRAGGTQGTATASAVSSATSNTVRWRSLNISSTIPPFTGVLTAVSGDTQEVTAGTKFPQYLHAKISNTTDLQDTAVTFSLSGPATFDYSDVPPQMQWASYGSQICTIVNLYSTGEVFSPRVVAGSTAGIATCTAWTSVATNTAHWNSLRVDPPPPTKDTLTAYSGDQQSVPVNTKFPNRLDAQLSGNASLAGAMVNFTLSGPAVFDYTDAPPNGLTHTSSTDCSVPVLATGHAISPAVTAGSTTGTATCIATSSIAAGPAHWNYLRVTDPPPPTKDTLTASSGDEQSAPVNTKFPYRLDAQLSGNASLTGATVNFTLNDLAVFDYTDAPPVGLTYTSPTDCSVPVLATGHAISPAVKAGSKAGIAGCTATSTIASNAAYWNHLFIVDAPPPDVGILTALDGDNQIANENTDFSKGLIAQLTGVTDTSNLLVRFKLSGPATFDYDRTPIEGTQGPTATECYVPVVANGMVYPPLVKAGNDAGVASCIATVSVARNPANWNNLKVVKPAPQGTLKVVSGDTQTAPENTKFPLALEVKVVGLSADDMAGAVVTFTLKGPATFDYADSQQAGTHEINDQKCTVPILSTGHAVSPTVLAGSTTGNATATATSDIAGNTAKWSNLTVSAPVVNIPYYVSVYSDASEPRSDQQDAVASTFFSALKATVLDQNQQPVTSGQIIFNDGTDSGDAVILPVGENNAPVTSGLAIQANVKAVANEGTSDYATAVVHAYPTDLSGKSLTNQPANRYATYSLRVWSATSAIVTATAGTPQTTKPNTAFAQQLKAKVTESNKSSTVANLQVSFMIVGGGASFELNTAIVDPSSTSTTAFVRTDASGIATSPTVLAGADAANVTVLATTKVSSAPATYALTIKDQDTPPADYMYELKPLSHNPATLNLNNWNVLNWQVWGTQTDAVYTGVVNCTATLKNANGTQLSFDPATIVTETTATASGGILAVPVFGGTVKATGATITAQADNDESAPNTVDIAFK